jgi:hypothetical protein
MLQVHPRPLLLGRAVQVDPIECTLKAPGTRRLKLQCDGLLFKLCFQNQLAPLLLGGVPERALVRGRGLHSSNSQLNFSRV